MILQDYFFGDDDSSVTSNPESEYSVDSHKDKRMRTDSGAGVGDSVLSSIVMGAFAGTTAGGIGSLNTNTLGSLANSGGAGGSRALSRTSSLGRDGVHNGVLSSSGNNSVNSSYISSNNTSTHTNLSSNYSVSSNSSGNISSNTSTSTTAGVRHSIMAMLGGYGDGDSTEMEDGGEGLRAPEEPTQSVEFAPVSASALQSLNPAPVPPPPMTGTYIPIFCIPALHIFQLVPVCCMLNMCDPSVCVVYCV